MRFAPVFATSALLALALSACAAGPDMTPVQDAPTPETVNVYAEAIGHYEGLMQTRSGEEDVVLGLARNLRWAGRADEAVAHLNAHPLNSAQYLAELGKAKIAQGRMTEGVDLLAQAAEKDPKDWRLFSALGIGHDYLSQWDDAKKAYYKALELCPDDPAVMNNLAISQGLSGDLNRAVWTLEDALTYGRHQDKIKANLRTIEGARDLCRGCGADVLRQAGGRILAAGLMGTDTASACMPEPEFTAPVVNVMTEQLAEAPSINIKVYFEFDSAILRPEAKGTLDELAGALNSEDLKGFRFELAGHTDAVGTEAYNQDLSERRAAAVKDYLIAEHGIDGARIDTVGLGESQLLDPENPESDVNRRVQVTKLGEAE